MDQGVWSSPGTYAAGDTATVAGVSYTCLVANGPGGPNPGQAGSETLWELTPTVPVTTTGSGHGGAFQTATDRGAWDNTDTYSAYDTVTHDGEQWLATADIAAGVAPGSDATVWTPFAGTPTVAGLLGGDGTNLLEGVNVAWFVQHIPEGTTPVNVVAGTLAVVSGSVSLVLPPPAVGAVVEIITTDPVAGANVMPPTAGGSLNGIIFPVLVNGLYMKKVAVSDGTDWFLT